jgi:hypothetical protein
MIRPVRYIVYPEGDIQEIPHPLRINMIVDLNGNPLPLPLSTDRMIAYEVFKITREEDRREESTYYHLSLLTRDELAQYVEVD